jgi:hypothetical protein
MPAPPALTLPAGTSPLPEQPQQQPGQAPAQRYFIAAEAVEWDYAPLGLDGCTGEAFGEGARVFVERVNGSTIGSRYLKALYVQYTDESFTDQVRYHRVL